MKKIAVLVSGGGTNLQAILDACDSGLIRSGEVSVVISSKEGAYALERAKLHGIEGIVLARKAYADRKSYSDALKAELDKRNIDLVVLAGFMIILDEGFIKAFENRIINVHPALIPSFCGDGFYGLRVHEAALAKGVKVTGATVHFVNEVCDGGPIILQKAVEIEQNDTPETLQRRVMEQAEWKLLPQAVELFCAGQLEVKGNIVNIKKWGNNMKKRAIISLTDKTGVVELARELDALGYEILSTGGTWKVIHAAGIPVTQVSDVTGFPECLDGRVKTLHPMIHAGILAMRSNPDHMAQLEKLGVTPIDIVAINLYPFKQTVLKPGVERAEVIENIDIGGPTMLRAAAKNYQDVSVIVDPADYKTVVDELKANGKVSVDTNLRLAYKVFNHTAAYDTLIQSYLRTETGADIFPDKLSLTYEKVQDMRYGENPHQRGAFYKEIGNGFTGTLAAAEQLHGKELSYNNINDTNGALDCLKEFAGQCAVVAVKHANPCGVGVGKDIHEAYMKAYNADPVSIFGGIVACSGEVDAETAAEINKIFVEIIVAPSYTEDALNILTQKKNIRILRLPDIMKPNTTDMLDMKKVAGGLLIQERDIGVYDDEKLIVVTEKAPTDAEMADLRFAMKVVKHTKSNAIVLAKDGTTTGVGPGQTNRITALELAVKYANATEGAEHNRAAGSVMASDAFFPFADCVECAAKAGITAIIQPGGSIRDQESIDACNKHGIAMVFTGIRHFKH